MALTKEEKQDIISKFGKTPTDTGSTEVQVAMLTSQIQSLSSHLQTHKKDFHSQRGLLRMVGRRKRLLSYLEKTNYEGYKSLIQELGLRR
jgi:small subunit ribosomal protein S15